MLNLYTQHDSNVRKTWLLMAVFLVLLIAIGFLFSYVLNSQTILYIAVILAIVTNFISYWNSDKIALSLSGARPADRANHLELYRVIENLTITAGLPMPRVYTILSSQINAFATGRDAKHAAIAVTEGALSKLNSNELQGVLAHELSHIGNDDILVSTVAVVLAGVIALMANFFFRVSFFGGLGRGNDRDNGEAGIFIVLAVVVAVLAPIAATLLQLAVSRKREYLADTSGALLTRYPEGLAGALEKIEQDTASMMTANNATAHLFISSPLKGKQAANWVARLFSTHPPLADRIRILRQMDIN